MSISLRRLAGREYRQEFAAHHLGNIRKAISVFGNTEDYRRRRRYARALNGQECLADMDSLQADKFARIGWPQEISRPFLRLCQDRLASTHQSEQDIQEGKQFYLNLLADEDYDPTSPYMQFALGEPLLNTVARYLGQAPYLQSIELIHSQPIHGETRLVKSQNWHRDNHNDQRLLKLFLYASPVTDRNGPLTFLPARVSDTVPWHAGHYIPDDRMAKYASANDQVVFEGEPGSTLLMDSASLYHFGSRCEEPRLTFVIHYNSGFGFRPRSSFHQRWAHKRESLSAVQKMALGA